MASKTATRPDFFARFPSIKRNDELDKKGVTDEERFIYGMSQTAGWKVFTNKKDALLRDMDAIQETAIANGVSEAEIGKNTIMFSFVKGILNKLWHTIDDCKEVCERPGGK